MNVGANLFTETLNAGKLLANSIKPSVALNVNSLILPTLPGDTDAGVPGDLKFVPTGSAAYLGIWICSVGTNQPTGNTWVKIAEPAGAGV
tara:strand:- start:1561 stop:1830 length:270 start_codon:yes stop_codon:yes gene_type:complete